MDVVPEDIEHGFDVQGFQWNDAFLREEYRHDRDENIYLFEESMNPKLECCSQLKEVILFLKNIFISIVFSFINYRNVK